MFDTNTGRWTKYNPNLKSSNSRPQSYALSGYLYKNFRFRVHYNTTIGQRILIVGDIPELGAWNVNRAIPLTYRPGGWWEGEINFNLDNVPPIVYYKYVVAGNNYHLWEGGANREVEFRRYTGHIEFRDNWCSK